MTGRGPTVIEQIRAVRGAVDRFFVKKIFHLHFKKLATHAVRRVVTAIVFNQMKLQKRLHPVQNIRAALIDCLLIVERHEHHCAAVRIHGGGCIDGGGRSVASGPSGRRAARSVLF